MAAAFAAYACFSPVMAQEPPSDIAIPAVEDGALPDAPAPLAVAIDAGGALPPDPCPMPSSELSRMPDDLAKVQADIDRYTLCMERAQLLQRLNDVALENQERLDQSRGGSGPNPGMQLDAGTPSFEDIRAQIMSSIDGASVSEEETAAAPPASHEWLIIRILGASGSLSAQLGKSDGTLTRVSAGDVLPDGAQVESVSATAVSITQDGEKKNLRWREEGGV